MTDLLAVPRSRELPLGRLEQRRRHLLDEVARAPRSARPRRYVVAGALLVAVVVAAPTLAVSSRVRELVGLSSSPPLVVRAPLMVSAPAAEGQTLNFFAVPAGVGGECWFVAAVRGTAQGTGRAGRLWVREGACVRLGGTVQAAHGTAPLEVAARASCGRGGSPPACVYGWIDPGTHADRVELRWQRGSEELVLEGGYFVGAVPAAGDGPFFVVAYDSSGAEVARRQVGFPSRSRSR